MIRPFRILAFSVLAGAGISAWAHGPQIQTTLNAGKIVTRNLVDDASYHTVLTDPIRVYVMSLGEYLGVWRPRPDGSQLPDGTPEFAGWPGFAYGYGYDATTNPAPFPLGSKFTLGFTAGLKSWTGATFADAGATEAEAYRGPSATPTALAKTSDVGPFQSLQFPGGAGISFTSEEGDTHNTVNYRMVGDGSSITSPLADGIYLLSFQLSSTESGVNPSDEFYFVLNKNTPWTTAAAAVNSLGISPSHVQWVAPEPHSFVLVGVAILAWLGRGRARKRGNG
jgi:hypothetical protein